MNIGKYIRRLSPATARRINSLRTLSSKADALEAAMTAELDYQVAVPNRHQIRVLKIRNPDDSRPYVMHNEPYLAMMPEKPTLLDFFKFRFAPANHLLQSARMAQDNGCSEKIILACLLHDIAVGNLIRTDHGFWGAQLVRPYVDEEVSWAIEKHQSLRFFPDPSVGYEYPQLYYRFFGKEYEPEDYVFQDYKLAKEHKWYMSARQITLNDLYAFDPHKRIEIEEFTDIIGRNFQQPKEGLGFDGSPTAHMWRSMIWPNNFL